MSTARTIRASKRRPTTTTPSSSAPGPGTGTTTSASVSATHAASSGGSSSKCEVLSLGCTRNDPPAVSSMWTTAEARARGASPASGALKSCTSASVRVATSRTPGEPHPRPTVRVTVRRTLSIRAACANAVGGCGQGLPLIGGLGIDPRVETHQQSFAACGHHQQDPGRHGE